MKGVFNEALKYGAVLGILMGLSRIFETWSLFLSDTDGVSVALIAEYLLAASVFIWVLYKSAKGIALKQEPERGFSYAQALSFILIVAMLAGLLAGVMHHIYIDVVGYERYIAGYLSLIDEYEALMLRSGVPNMYGDMLVEMRAVVREQEPQSIFGSIFSAMYSYMISGLMVGLVISAFVRRDPQPAKEE